MWRRRAAPAALAFAGAYGLLRLYWAVGGRWGYTACEPAASEGVSAGCGAEQLSVLPFWNGWGAVLLCGLLVAVAAALVLRPGRAVVGAAWAAGAGLVVAAFPLHLLFQIPAALGGQETDWRDVVNRLLLLAGGLLFGAAAAAGHRGCGHPRGHDRGDEPRPVPAWVRWWSYAAVAVPVLGWAVPHGLWLLGVPFGIPAEELAGIRGDLGTGTGVAITLVPPLASLLTLGLAQRWGQRFPRWLPGAGGRRVPRLLALVPAGVVAVALVAYGVLSAAIMATAVLTGPDGWSMLASGWAVGSTVLVFAAWGVSLGVTALGYYSITRARCEICDDASRSVRPARRA